MGEWGSSWSQQHHAKHVTHDSSSFLLSTFRVVATAGISVYILPPPNQSTLQIFMWLLVVFFLFDAGQIRYRASVRLSSCFFYLLTHHNLYPPNEIPGYGPVDVIPVGRCFICQLQITQLNNIDDLLTYFQQIT